MKIISHRGNLHGPYPERENSLYQIRELRMLYPDFCIEVDMWKMGTGPNAKWFLGHDYPKTLIMDLDEFLRQGNLYCHCKSNIDAYEELTDRVYTCKNDVFCHDKDDFAYTYNQYYWIHPNAILKNIPNKENLVDFRIAVLPEQILDISNQELCKTVLGNFDGICTDFPMFFNDLFNGKKE